MLNENNVFQASEDKVEPAEKKMSHKEKKKLKKQQEYEKQMELLTKKGGQGHSELDANFTVSQAQKSAGMSRKKYGHKTNIFFFHKNSV